MQFWKDKTNHVTTRFCVEDDAKLFSRAATKLWSWNLAPDAKDAPLPFPVFYERRQIFFPVAAFATCEAQELASALFAHFAPDARYPTKRGTSCYAPLQMTTKSFLEEFAASPNLPQPYDVAVAFFTEVIQERPLDDVQTELETFLATTNLVIPRRDIPRWKDIFQLVLLRTEAAQQYAKTRHFDVTDEMLDAFLESYQTRLKDSATLEDVASPELSEPYAPTKGHAAPTASRTLRRTHKVLVDADACPVVDSIEKISERYGVPVVLCCDDSRAMESTYSDILRVPCGKHAADAAIIAICHKGDIVVTEDAGLALLALAKEAFPIASDGWRYTHRMLRQRDGAELARRNSKRHLHKRTDADDEAFERGFLALLHRKFFGEDEW